MPRTTSWRSLRNAVYRPATRHPIQTMASYCVVSARVRARPKFQSSPGRGRCEYLAVSLRAHKPSNGGEKKSLSDERVEPADHQSETFPLPFKSPSEEFLSNRLILGFSNHKWLHGKLGDRRAHSIFFRGSTQETSGLRQATQQSLAVKLCCPLLQKCRGYLLFLIFRGTAKCESVASR